MDYLVGKEVIKKKAKISNHLLPEDDVKHQKYYVKEK